MLEQERKIDELLSQLREDKDFIHERQSDRQQKYAKSTKLFLRSVQKEMKTIDDTREAHKLRNEQFYNQIKDVYTRYQSGSYNLINTFRKTQNQKIKFNDSILNNYPQLIRDQQDSLKQKNNQMKDRLKELQLINQKGNNDYYQILNQKYEGISQDVAQQREKLEGELNEIKRTLRPQGVQSQPAMLDNFIQQQPQSVKQDFQPRQQSQQEFEQPMRFQQQQQFGDLQQQGTYNLEQYAGLRSGPSQAQRQKEARQLLEDFTQPQRTNPGRQQQKSRNQEYDDYPANEIQPPISLNQRGQYTFDSQSRQTFHESTDQQSSDPSAQKTDNQPDYSISNRYE